MRGSIADIYNQHQIAQVQNYKWRDQWLSSGHKVFEAYQQSQREAMLEEIPTFGHFLYPFSLLKENSVLRVDWKVKFEWRVGFSIRST